MGSWHRENPELVGTDADPWMANPTHRKVFEQLRREGHIWIEEDDEPQDGGES